MMFLKAASVLGSLMIVIALAITLLKALIGLVGFIAVALKIIIVLVFVAVFASVGFMLFKAWQGKQNAA